MPDWQEILDRDGQAAWRTAYRILGDRDDADECLQEAFLGALEVSRREDVRHWRALLQRLATARAMDRLRRRHRREARRGPTDWDQLPCPAPIPPQSAEDAELSERLRAALAQLPSKQAEAFCLHCLEGWSYQQVSQHLSASVDSVGVLIHRARKQLRRLMGIPEPSRNPGSNSPRSSRESP